jgi:hypothetical protein
MRMARFKAAKPVPPPRPLTPRTPRSPQTEYFAAPPMPPYLQRLSYAHSLRAERAALEYKDSPRTMRVDEWIDVDHPQWAEFLATEGRTGEDRWTQPCGYMPRRLRFKGCPWGPDATGHEQEAWQNYSTPPGETAQTVRASMPSVRRASAVAIQSRVRARLARSRLAGGPRGASTRAQPSQADIRRRGMLERASHEDSGDQVHDAADGRQGRTGVEEEESDAAREKKRRAAAVRVQAGIRRMNAEIRYNRKRLNLRELDEGNSNFEQRSRLAHSAAVHAAGLVDDDEAASGPFHQKRARARVYEELLRNSAAKDRGRVRELSGADKFFAVVRGAQRAQLQLPPAGIGSAFLAKEAAERAVRCKPRREELVAPPPPGWW